MAPKDELTRHEREQPKNNETVNLLLSRLDYGGKLLDRDALRLHFRQWLAAVNENDEVPSRVPEFLFRVLINFTTPEKAKEIQDIQVPVTSTASGRWLVKLRALLAEKPDERLLRLLDRMPDRMVWCHDTMLKQENPQNPVFDANQDEQYHRKLREIMRHVDREEMRGNRAVFYITGTTAWTVRPPYWHVALATDTEGNRFLTDIELGRVLPDWRQILDGQKAPSPRYPVAVRRFKEWLKAENRKASRLGKA